MKVKKAGETKCMHLTSAKLTGAPVRAMLLSTKQNAYTRERKLIFMGSLFEMIMLVCFGFSWPINVVKAYKAQTARGTSLPFILLIITGYLAGIAAKVMNGQFNYVLLVYLMNLAIVFTNLLVYFRNVSLDKKRIAA